MRVNLIAAMISRVQVNQKQKETHTVSQSVSWISQEKTKTGTRPRRLGRSGGGTFAVKRHVARRDREHPCTYILTVHAPTIPGLSQILI
jgi:hypothetical protein